MEDKIAQTQEGFKLKWLWLLSPLGFNLAYAVIMLFLWMPLARTQVVARMGAGFLPYWGGEVAGVILIQFLALILIVLLLAPFILLFAPAAGFWRVTSASVAWGILTSVLQQIVAYVTKSSLDIIAYFEFPLLADAILIVTSRWQEICSLARELRSTSKV